MLLFRVSNKKYISSVDGIGGTLRAGRWHKKGTPILYTSSTTSLAKWEVLANLGYIPKDYLVVTYNIPDDTVVEEVLIEDLPDDWNDAYNYNPITQEIATELFQKDVWVIKVPSAQTPGEFNYLVNPRHPDHVNLEIVEINPVHVDRRIDDILK